MNKRIKKKISKLTNSKRQNDILDQLSKHFTIQNKQFINGYFMFYHGENSVCHFSIKETPNWKYGIWLEENNKFEIFGEHKELIDKFKPSRCCVSHENNLEEFIQEVKNISNNPKLYFVESLTGCALVDWKEEYDINGNISHIRGYQVIREYNEETKCWDKFRRDKSITQDIFVENKYNEFMNNNRIEKENEEFDRRYAFKFFKELPNLFDEIVAVGINDKNKKGWICSPRYEIKIVIDKNVNQEKFDTLYNQLDELIRNKNYSDERKSYEHKFDLYGCFDDIKDIKNCDYKYHNE
jgi:hypothetical protein